MKGLIRNNLYAAYTNVRIFAVAMVLAGIFAAAVISRPLLNGYIVLSMIGFPAVSISGLHNEGGCKWAKYKLTTPVRRADIVKSYYICQLIWLIAGTAVAMAVAGLSALLHGFPFMGAVDALHIFALGLSISLLMSGVFFAVHGWGDGEKNEAFLIISMVGSAAAVMALSSFMDRLLPDMADTKRLMGIAVTVGVALAGFLASFPVATVAFMRKEI